MKHCFTISFFTVSIIHLLSPPLWLSTGSSRLKIFEIHELDCGKGNAQFLCIFEEILEEIVAIINQATNLGQ